MVQLSTGDMLRAAVRARTPVGIAAKAVMDAGGLVSDVIVEKLIDERLMALTPANGIIFDGYPRTVTQIDALDALLETHDRYLNHVVELAVNEEALVERVTGRLSCTTCGAGYHNRFKPPVRSGHCDRCGSSALERRSDDTAEAVRARLAEYRAKTMPILPLYEARGLLKRIDGMADADEVAAAIADILDRFDS